MVCCGYRRIDQFCPRCGRRLVSNLWIGHTFARIQEEIEHHAANLRDASLRLENLEAIYLKEHASAKADYDRQFAKMKDLDEALEHARRYQIGVQ
jgi:hypothetical protein